MNEDSIRNKDLKKMIRRCKEKHGVATPRLFNGMDSTCSANTPMRRFGSWDEARKEAGIEEHNTDRTGQKKEHSDGDILRDIKKCAERHDGKATVSLMNEEVDLVAPSIAIKRFGSWDKATEKAGINPDARREKNRPRKYSDEQYYELLRKLQNRYGECTQRKFDEDNDFPSSRVITKRFENWDTAVRNAGINPES